MGHFDVFNGDADGICALQQLRLAQPRAAALVTGVKRDIALLARVPAQAGDTVTVLDVSLDRNRVALLALLERGVEVDYFDHHFAGGPLPVHARLRMTIDTAPGTCTSLLADRHLRGRHRAWAVVGAFGDNLAGPATALARELKLGGAEVEALRELGEAINYNAYGDSEEDLLLPPARLYERLRPHADPLAFIAADPLAGELSRRQREDLACADAHAVALPPAGAWQLPDAAWARRVMGSYANALARREPQRAHAVLREAASGEDVVSVRAPHTAPRGAEVLCRAFGGSGRAAAAGIDRLPRGRREAFLDAFARAFDTLH
ncbi:acetyltransferase [Variovorax defluvii]|uniref:acetyltransferase n=1 Tax=Variovorax defluvii TaxID=913761 RepID=UPI0031E8D9D1